MEIISTIATALEIALFGYLGLSAFYLFFFALVSKFKRHKHSKPFSASAETPRIQVLIPAYKADAVIVKTAEKCLEMDYPSAQFEVMIIADGLADSTLRALNELPVEVLPVNFEKSTKAKALNAAIAATGNVFQLAVILDADNHPQKDFLRQIAQAYHQGHRIIQGCRLPKNTDTAVATLDAISEAINFSIYNQGPANMGLSARLVGSAMAFHYPLFAQLMKYNDAVGGFDKALELSATLLNEHIHYAPEAKVLDEKVQQAEVFQNQRKRWIAAQFHYLTTYRIQAFQSLTRFRNADFLNKYVQMALPPRLLLPVALLLLAMLGAALQSKIAFLWWLAFTANVLANLIALPVSFYSLKALKAMLKVPSLIWRTLRVLLHLKSANQSFIHTPHQAI